MSVNIADPFTETLLFEAILLGFLLLSIRKSSTSIALTPDHTNELKGFAILAIIFSHISFFLVNDQKFLYPVNIWAGLGVNLFLILSGYGLTVSALKKPLSLDHFYRKRLLRLFAPLWLTLVVFLILDATILQRTYPVAYTIQSLVGFFPTDDVTSDLNSPLWYFTLILFYYLIYPIVTYRWLIFISPLLIILISQFLLQQRLPVNEWVLNLYKLHYLAFPLGIFIALITQKLSWPRLKLATPLRPILLFLALAVFLYTSFHSNVGVNITSEQQTSLICALALIAVFTLKTFKLKLLEVFGLYSYEIYLIHFPLLSRYHYLYNYLPAFLATLVSLAMFLLISFFIQKTVKLTIKND